MNVRAAPIGWSNYLEALIEKLDPFCGVDIVRLCVLDRKLHAWQVFADDVSLGCFITRIDRRYDGEKDLVLLFTVAEFETKQAISSVMYELLERLARANKIKYIRIHVDRPALSRIVEHAGFTFLESVYIKEVPL